MGVHNKMYITTTLIFSSMFALNMESCKAVTRDTRKVFTAKIKDKLLICKYMLMVLF